MNKQEVYDFLKEKNIWHEITEHPAVFSMDELGDIVLPYPEADAKNLFVRDDKKKNYYLIVVRGNKKVNLKEFKKAHGTRNLSFASAEDLMSMLKLIAGSVSPFGILSDEERKVEVFLDEDFISEPNLMGVHPNDNTATVWIKTVDMIDLLREHGNTVNLAKL